MFYYFIQLVELSKLDDILWFPTTNFGTQFCRLMHEHVVLCLIKLALVLGESWYFETCFFRVFSNRKHFFVHYSVWNEESLIRFMDEKEWAKKRDFTWVEYDWWMKKGIPHKPVDGKYWIIREIWTFQKTITISIYAINATILFSRGC